MSNELRDLYACWPRIDLRNGGSSARPTDSEQERPVFQGTDSVPNTSLDRDEGAGHDFPLMVSGREDESAADRLHGDRSGGDMLVQLGTGAHRDQDDPQTWRFDQCF